MATNTPSRRRVKAFLLQNKSEEVINFLERAKVKKIEYPSIEILLSMIEKNGIIKTAQEIGCSDRSIRNFLKKNVFLN